MRADALNPILSNSWHWTVKYTWDAFPWPRERLHDLPRHGWQKPLVQDWATSEVQLYCMANAFILTKWHMHCDFNYGNQESFSWLTTKPLSNRRKTTRSLNLRYYVSGASFICFISNKLCSSVVSIRKLQMRLKIMHPIIFHPSLFHGHRQNWFSGGICSLLMDEANKAPLL